MEDNSDKLNNSIDCDSTDALGFSLLIHPFVNLIGALFASGSSNKPKPEVQAICEKEAYFYNMNHKKRGLALIFNHERFIVPYLKNRTGTNVDCERLAKSFRSLDFDVSVHIDLSVRDLIDTVEKVARMDHSENDCLVMAILTHGEEGILFARDGAYKHEQIFSNFKGDVCPSLVGKPKIFFIQACQGSKLDPGVKLTQVDSAPGSYKIPIMADFLMVYSTIPGYYSWRNTTQGSWFVQALIAELTESGTLYDLLTLLTFVCRRVALDFESRVPDNAMMDQQKQIPCVTSMLTRLIKFSPKSINKNNSINIQENVINSI